MSYIDTLKETLNPQTVMESLGLRRHEPTMVDVLVPVLAAFGVGVVLGAAGALLLAPQSGEDLRDDISDRATKLADQARSAAKNVRAQLPGQDGVLQREEAEPVAVKPRPSTTQRTYGTS